MRPEREPWRLDDGPSECTSTRGPLCGALLQRALEPAVKAAERQRGHLLHCWFAMRMRPLRWASGVSVTRVPPRGVGANSQRPSTGGPSTTRI